MITETIDASKIKIGVKEALALSQKAKKIIAAKGSKVTILDLKKDKPSDDDIAALLMGPTGNLRATRGLCRQWQLPCLRFPLA